MGVGTPDTRESTQAGVGTGAPVRILCAHARWCASGRVRARACGPRGTGSRGGPRSRRSAPGSCMRATAPAAAETVARSARAGGDGGGFWRGEAARHGGSEARVGGEARPRGQSSQGEGASTQGAQNALLGPVRARRQQWRASEMRAPAPGGSLRGRRCCYVRERGSPRQESGPAGRPPPSRTSPQRLSWEQESEEAICLERSRSTSFVCTHACCSASFYVPKLMRKSSLNIAANSGSRICTKRKMNQEFL